MDTRLGISFAVSAALLAAPQASAAQMSGDPQSATTHSHSMWMRSLAGEWKLMGMAQAFPVTTIGAPFDTRSPLRDPEVYLTQPALMVNLESPESRWTLRTTLNFEGITQPGGEYAFGGWGEGFLDKRHPHTLVHELMLSYNLWAVPGGSASLSAGKGFAPYGTDDPMSRPVLKYPTNHHLSQILERWTVNAVYLHRSGLSFEVGLFGGGEPDGPYDFSNIESFGDSWSARIAQRLGGRSGPFAPWELSASYARVEHGKAEPAVHLMNTAVRHDGRYPFGRLYALLEASRSDPDGPGRGYFAILGESRLELGRDGRHQPYYRIEYATRPEYHRAGPPGTEAFYRYDHAHEDSDRATRWLINSAGYGYDIRREALSVRPFVEIQHHRVWAERGGVSPSELFRSSSFWAISTGARVFIGGGGMRMGSYGVLNPMTAGMRPEMAAHGSPLEDTQRHSGHHGSH